MFFPQLSVSSTTILLGQTLRVGNEEHCITVSFLFLKKQFQLVVMKREQLSLRCFEYEVSRELSNSLQYLHEIIKGSYVLA